MNVTSLVVRDEHDEPIGYVRESTWSGWLWSCALCPAANAPAAASPSPIVAVSRLVSHLTREHVTASSSEPSTPAAVSSENP